VTYKKLPKKSGGGHRIREIGEKKKGTKGERSPCLGFQKKDAKRGFRGVGERGMGGKRNQSLGSDRLGRDTGPMGKTEADRRKILEGLKGD